MPRLRTLRFLCLLPLALAGCGTVTDWYKSAASVVGLGPPQPKAPDWESLVVAADADANQNSPVAVDLVFVRDPALVDALMTTPAAKWFATKNDTLRSFPQGLGVVALELVPAQSVRMGREALRSQRALAVFAFANYPPPGEHRERLLPGASAYLLQLGAAGFKAAPVTPGK